MRLFTEHKYFPTNRSKKKKKQAAGNPKSFEISQKLKNERKIHHKTAVTRKKNPEIDKHIHTKGQRKYQAHNNDDDRRYHQQTGCAHAKYVFRSHMHHRQNEGVLYFYQPKLNQPTSSMYLLCVQTSFPNKKKKILQKKL